MGSIEDARERADRGVGSHLSVEIPSALFEAIVDRIETGVYALNLERKVVYWNHGAEQITGYLGQEVLGREYRADLVVEDEEHSPLVCVHPCPLESPVGAGLPQRVMTYLRHRAGHVVPVLLWTLSLRNAAGQVEGSIKIFSEQLTAAEPRHTGLSLNPAEHQDPDTGLPGRTAVEAFLHAHSEVANATKVPCGMIVVQLAIEDFGHAHGKAAASALMKEVGCTLQEMIRGTDLVGRWAENCFVAVLPDCGPVVLEHVAGRMRRVAGRVAIPWTGDRLSSPAEVRSTLITPGEDLAAAAGRVFPAQQCEQGTTSGSPR